MKALSRSWTADLLFDWLKLELISIILIIDVLDNHGWIYNYCLIINRFLFGMSFKCHHRCRDRDWFNWLSSGGVFFYDICFLSEYHFIRTISFGLLKLLLLHTGTWFIVTQARLLLIWGDLFRTYGDIICI